MDTGHSHVRAAVQGRGTVLMAASLVIAVLVTGASLLGLLAPWPYRQETRNWVLQARGQDVGNLFAVVVLVISAISLRRSARAFHVWTGTLFYLAYAYIVYAFAVHFSPLFLAYVAILGLVSYTLITALRPSAWRLAYPHGRVRGFAAGVLIGTGALFCLLWLSELIPATFSGQPPSSLATAGLIVNPVHVIDLSVVLPGLITVGILALRGNGTGSFLTVPALVFSVLMGSSIIAAMVLIVADGDTSGFVPLGMVSVVVLASLAAAIAYARRTAEPDRPPARPAGSGGH